MLLYVLYLCGSVSVVAQPLTQREACAKFSDAIVSIDAGGESRGSGFLVSADGLILTAAHVVHDESGAIHGAIAVTLADGSLEFASVAFPESLDSMGKDFVLLRIAPKKPLPFLQIGGDDDVVIGADATIIGFPFSAISPQGDNVTAKFCLSAAFAGMQGIMRPVKGTWKGPKGAILPINQNISVKVIYFQGPSVKGISGSPIIARDNGRVVGIVTTKLAGIGEYLADVERQTASPGNGSLTVGNLDFFPTVHQIVTVLDQQLANGLGSATGIDAPADILRDIQRKKK
jgi:serine protease Do